MYADKCNDYRHYYNRITHILYILHSRLVMSQKYVQTDAVGAYYVYVKQLSGVGYVSFKRTYPLQTVV